MVCPDQYQHMLAHALEVQARRQLLVEVLIQVHAAQQRPRRPPARMARVQAQEHAFLVSIVSAIARCRPLARGHGHGPWAMGHGSLGPASSARHFLKVVQCLSSREGQPQLAAPLLRPFAQPLLSPAAGQFGCAVAVVRKSRSRATSTVGDRRILARCSVHVRTSRVPPGLL